MCIRDRCLRVDGVHLGAGADANLAGLDPFDGVQRRDVEQHAARQRHRLAIVAGAAGAHRQRHAVACTGGGDPHHVGFVAWRDDHVGRLAVELLVEDRAVPEEIT